MSKVIINRGKRTYTLVPGEDKKPRVLGPGQSIETTSEAEAVALLKYKDLQDSELAVPQTAKKVQELERQLAAAKAENEKLKQASQNPVQPPESPSEGDLPPEVDQEPEPEEKPVKGQAAKPKAKRGR